MNGGIPRVSIWYNDTKTIISYSFYAPKTRPFIYEQILTLFKSPVKKICQRKYIFSYHKEDSEKISHPKLPCIHKITNHKWTYHRINPRFNPERNKNILVMDGTYLFIPRSAEHRCSRQGMCFKGNRRLVKPMMIGTTTGLSLDIWGPYIVKNGNNEITMDVIHYKKGGFHDFLNQ